MDSESLMSARNLHINCYTKAAFPFSICCCCCYENKKVQAKGLFSAAADFYKHQVGSEHPYICWCVCVALSNRVRV